MKKIIGLLLICSIVCCCFFCGCESTKSESPSKTVDVEDKEDDKKDDTEEKKEDGEDKKEPEDEPVIPEDLEEKVNTLSVSCSEGTDNCWTFEDNVLTFGGLTADTVCSVTGELDGAIIIDAGDDYKFELELCGVTIFSNEYNPITVNSGDKVTLSAKKDKENFIYDKREAVSSEDEDVYSAAIYAKCDLDLQGKGKLTVISENNNGIHTKDNLEVKNVTLSVTCENNAIKGNDGVEISGGIITLIAKTGDGIKTSNTDVSKKGKQRGIVEISGGTVVIYAACDGIDAAYDVDISGDPVIEIYTDSNSPYSETVEKSKDEDYDETKRYIRFTSSAYSYSVKYYNSDSDYVWANATYCKSVKGGMSTYYYYSFDKLDGYSQVKIFIYSSTQTQGQENDCLVQSDYMTWNTAYDTFALEQRGQSLMYNWTNYTTSVSDGFGGWGGGPGGMDDGNSDKGDYSTKGIKAGNEVNISGGLITVEAYDDAIHANNETALENGETPTGDVNISGGTVTVSSQDDGIHADGTVNVSGGKIEVLSSYEGIEGLQIVIDGGDISIVSKDDGMNATTTSGVGMTFNGGTVYVYAGGDGIDANSKTSYKGIVFNGGSITIVSTSGGNSSIDTEQGYTYNGGTVLALCPSNGMGSESTKCSNFSTVGTKSTMSLKKGQVLTVKVGSKETISVEMPCQLSALVIYLGASGASFSTK